MRHTILSAVLLAVLVTFGVWATTAAAQQSSSTAASTTKATSTAKTTSTARAATTPAADDPESQPIREGSGGPVSVSGGIGGTLVRLMIGLLLVVGLIFAVWWVMKRVQRSRYPAVEADATGLIGVMATTPLGPNRALHLVRVGDEVVLVGATEQSVQAVARLDAATASAITRAADSPGRTVVPTGSGQPGGESLLDRLRRMTARP